MTEQFHPLGQAIMRDREERERKQIADKLKAKQQANKSFDAFETAKDTLQQGATHDSGWIINPDSITTKRRVDPNAGDVVYCLPGKFAAAAEKIQDAAKWDLAMEDAGWRQTAKVWSGTRRLNYYGEATERTANPTIADQRARQAADWATIIALTEAKGTGTLKESLDAAVKNYTGRSIRSAMVEALAGMAEQTRPHPSEFGIPPELWVNAMRYADACDPERAVLVEYDQATEGIRFLPIDVQGGV